MLSFVGKKKMRLYNNPVRGLSSIDSSDDEDDGDDDSSGDISLGLGARNDNSFE